MGRTIKTVLPGLLVGMAALLCTRCTGPTKPDHAGTATETENVVGKLFQPDGKTPAAGVRVFIRPKKTLADTSGTGLPKRMAAVDSVVTDTAGRFAFDTTLDTGTYVIEAASGNDAVLIDSVAVTSHDSTDSLPPDTLKPAGALKGVIGLSEGGDPRKVFMLAFGIDRFAHVNADGSFRFAGLAEAKYDLRLISSLDNYGVLDTVGIPVRSADTTNLDTISLPFTGIPTPRGITLSYDTLKQIVTITWSKADTALVKGYNVYRRNVDSNTVLTRINTSPITDTVYRDSTGIQGQTYEYRLSAVDKNASEGTKSELIETNVAGGFVISDTLLTISGLGFPFSVQIDKHGNYIVANGIGTDVQSTKPAMLERHRSDGLLINSWSIPGGIEGSYTYVNVAIDDSGDILIATKDDKVLVFDTSGTALSQFQFPGKICGFLISRDTLFIADRTAHTISAYTLHGSKLFSWGTAGSGEGQFSTIVSMVSDSIGNIYVEDVNNSGRLQAFRSTGVFLYSIDLGQFGIVGADLDISNNDLFAITQITGGMKLFAFNSLGVFRFRCQLPQAINKIISSTPSEIVALTWEGKVIRITRT